MSDIAVITLLVTILIALLGVAFGYGILTNKVNGHSKDIERLDATYKTIDTKLDTICNKVAGIEATLAEQKRERKT